MTEYLFWGAKGGSRPSYGGGGQEYGIAMKGAQSKVKWGRGPMGGGEDDGLNGGGPWPQGPPPHSYVTAEN